MHSAITSLQPRRRAVAPGQARRRKILAGGQSLVQARNCRLASPPTSWTSAREGPRGIKADGTPQIGAMTRHADVEASADVKKLIPALARLAGGIGDRQVRHMGTIAGRSRTTTLRLLPAAVLGLGATITTTSARSAGTISQGTVETALETGELITA